MNTKKHLFLLLPLFLWACGSSVPLVPHDGGVDLRGIEVDFVSRARDFERVPNRQFLSGRRIDGDPGFIVQIVGNEVAVHQRQLHR